MLQHRNVIKMQLRRNSHPDYSSRKILHISIGETPEFLIDALYNHALILYGLSNRFFYENIIPSGKS